jgi:hypothetical protein
VKRSIRVLARTPAVLLYIVAATGLACDVHADTVAFSNNFENNTNGFTVGGSLAAGGLSRFQLPTDGGQLSSANQSMWLGRLGFNVAKVASVNGGPSDEIVGLNLTGLTAGTVYTVAFDLFIGGSWDGAADRFGQDRWRFSVDGTRLVDTMFANGAQGVNFGAYSPQRYTDTFYSSPGTSANDVSRFSGADYSYSANINGNYGGDYAIYSFSNGAGNPVLNFTATSSTAALQFARFGNTTDSADEYWALDNVLVTTPSDTAAAAPLPANLPGGFALLGAFFGAGLWRRLSRPKLVSPQPMLLPCVKFQEGRPAFETLEERRLFSTLTVLNILDSGAGSLRSAIAAAHNGDTIVFASSLAGQTITLSKGELLISHNVTVAGPGAGQLTISGNHASRVFEVAAGTQVTLSGLTIANGLTAGGDGGGILNGGTLTVSGSTLSGNSTTDRWKGNTNTGGHGGGIYNSGTLTVDGNTILSGNSATAVGGGIDNAGVLTLSNSAVLHNTGNGIFNFGTATVRGSTLSGNTASSGAGIWSGGTLTVSGSTLSNNISTGYGGGIAIMGTGTANVSASILSGNSAAGNGGGIFNQGTLMLGGSDLSGNSAGNDGGGLWIGFYATATVSGTTVTGNSAAQGGGIWNWHNTLTIENSSSITGNTAPVGFGADVYNLGTVNLDGSSIIGVLDGNPAMSI